MTLGGSRLSALRSFAPAWVAVLLCGAGASAVAAATVEIKDGNIFVVDVAQRRQLTRSGRDADAVLAPDGKTVAFTRVGNPQSSGMQGDCKSGAQADELRRIRVDGGGDELLVRGQGRPEGEPVRIPPQAVQLRRARALCADAGLGHFRRAARLRHPRQEAQLRDAGQRRSC